MSARLCGRSRYGLSPARDGPDAKALNFQDIALETSLRSLLLYDMTQRDKSGRPILIELVGQWNCDKLAQLSNTDAGLETMIRGHVVCIC
eukprot:COSAG02_NODE_622_length_19435_cov_3.242398_17_plen_90_part_00